MSEKYDIVIIGSGLGGLECGYILSKRGYDVCILEKHSKLGGCLQSYHRERELLDTGFHYVGGLDKGQPLHTLFDYFGLMDLDWHRLDDNGFDEVILGDRSYLLHNGYDSFTEHLAESFPHQRENLKKYTALLRQVGENIFDGFRPKGSEELTTRSLFSRSAWSFLEETITDPELRNVLSGTSLKMELAKETLPLYIFAQINSSFIRSAWRIRGGGEAIATCLADSIRRMGGTVINHAEVKELTEKDGILTEAVLKGGERIAGGTFISDIHPSATLTLIKDSQQIRQIYRKRISALRNTGGTFTASLLLRKGVLPYLNRNQYIYECRDIWEPAPEGVTDRAMVSWIIPEEGSHARCVDLLTPVRWSEVAEWEGTRIKNRGAGYEEYKQRKADELIDFACAHGILSRSDIESIYTSTPLSWNGYTGTPEGSSYGIVKDWRDPLRTVLAPKTPVPNLFLTGQNLNLHGILGVSMTSFITCSALTGENIFPEQEAV